jgi:hypothetical protein
MIVWLTKDVYIKADKLSFDLIERRYTEKERTPYHKALGYYSSFEDAATAALKKVVASKDVEIQLTELMAIMKSTKEEIAKACWGVTHEFAKNETRVFNGTSLESFLNFDGEEE